MKKLLITTLTIALISLMSFAPQAKSEEVLSKGTFSGFLTHTTSGSFTIVRRDDGKTELRLGEDFFQDGAPDPYLGFGGGSYDSNSEIAFLESNTGAQSYVIPDGINYRKYVKVYVWCKAYSVTLGVAHMERP